MEIHRAVLVKEVVEFLVIKEEGVYIDATAGFGGHSRAILSKLNNKGFLVGIDRDSEAVKYLSESIKDSRFRIIKGNFASLKELIRGIGIDKADGILFDLGVSLFQLKELDRGFSFLSDARLDMRMDTSQKLDAWEIVNRYPQRELERIFKEFGEESHAKRIARAIVKKRERDGINTCKELASLVERIYVRRGRLHPATKVFQALRIEVNEELKCLQRGLIEAYELLNSGGRLCVISYHSLEDRIVKNFLKDYASTKKMVVITKKPILPSIEERLINPSSRSAKLRVGEKV
ncbi:MAG: 16S rRNA (cytosine(1402)-N(4))-methyltransferase RsmH [Thermodesulfovibrionales bacterium]|nr:16S rRNA (cytosine(1402)-N(4))-methyltransferase RsmH [Thermodesulfovibrionales bacterium]